MIGERSGILVDIGLEKFPLPGNRYYAAGKVGFRDAEDMDDHRPKVILRMARLRRLSTENWISRRSSLPCDDHASLYKIEILHRTLPYATLSSSAFASYTTPNVSGGVEPKWQQKIWLNPKFEGSLSDLHYPSTDQQLT